MFDDNGFESGDENDSFWTFLQRTFSVNDAVYFRNYPVRVFNTIRELDYMLFHRRGALIICLKETFDPEDVSYEEKGAYSGRIRIWDGFLEDYVYYGPADLALSFAYSLRHQFKKLNISIEDTAILIWLPTRRRGRNRPDYGMDRVIFLSGEDLTVADWEMALEGYISPQYESAFNLWDWERIRQALKPPSPIQSLTPSMNREEQQKLSIALAEEYRTKFQKDTLAFISYRRDDAGWAAGRVYSHLEPIFESKLFFDWASIKPGVDWRDAIDQALDDCIIQLVVMGPQWATLTKPPNTSPRILEKDDMVAHEVRMALRKRVTTIPLLIDDAPMPHISALPHGVKQLPRRNAVLLNQDNFFPKMNTIVDRMIELLNMAVNP